MQDYTTTQTQNNLIEAAISDYSAKGWLTFPLPSGEKFPPPKKVTGGCNPTPSSARLSEEWEKTGFHRNLGLVLKTSEDSPFDLVGFDVDAYGDKAGAETWETLLTEFPELETVRSTRRGSGNVSGTRFYRVAKGVNLRSPGAGIDLISRNHRYSVSYPSVIAKDGLRYEWISPEGETVEAPEVSDLPELPEDLVKRLTAPSRTTGDVDGEPVEFNAAISWLEDNALHNVKIYEEDGTELGHSGSVSFDALRDPELFAGGANKEMFALVARWVESAVRYGAQNVLSALVALRGLYTEELTSRTVARRSAQVAEREWRHAVEWSVGQVKAEVEAGLYLPVHLQNEVNAVRWPDSENIEWHAPEETSESVLEPLGIEPESAVETYEDLGATSGTAETSEDRLEAYAAQVTPEELTPKPKLEKSSPNGLIDLSEILADDYVPLEPSVGALTDGTFLLYPGEVHDVHGYSGSGKSWVGLALAAQEIQAGNAVLWIDNEQSPVVVVNRLKALGLTAVEILENLGYMRPEELPLRGTESEKALSQALKREWSLCVIDGVTNSFGLGGLESNSTDDANRWHKALPERVAKTGAAVVQIDHTVKSRDGDLSHAFGAQGKRANVAVSFGAQVQLPLRPGHTGRLKLIAYKDRHGALFARGEPLEKGSGFHVATFVLRGDNSFEFLGQGAEPVSPLSGSTSSEVDLNAQTPAIINAVAATVLNGGQGATVKAILGFWEEHAPGKLATVKRNKVEDKIKGETGLTKVGVHYLPKLSGQGVPRGTSDLVAKVVAEIRK